MNWFRVIYLEFSKSDLPLQSLVIDSKFQEALKVYRTAGSVLFMSYCRFWEQHGFVQQALARLLSDSGVDVTWLDGSGWRHYEPTVKNPVGNLHVRQMPELPLRRFNSVDLADIDRKKNFLKKYFANGKKPIVWIQGGIDERLADFLPYVDVFSVFDDPYRHDPRGMLSQKANVIICQNTFSKNLYASAQSQKVFHLFPPMDLTKEEASNAYESMAAIQFPDGFPEKVMGYIGSFFTAGFDFDLFEAFMLRHKDWGFLLAGRTDAEGIQRMENWKHHKNFFSVGWMPNDRLAPLWRKLQLSLLFYKENKSQDGAFPVKVLDGLKYGVPAIATRVPKTEDLAEYFPLGENIEALSLGVQQALDISKARRSEIFQKLLASMDPVAHLTTVAEMLRLTVEKRSSIP